MPDDIMVNKRNTQSLPSEYMQICEISGIKQGVVQMDIQLHSMINIMSIMRENVCIGETSFRLGLLRETSLRK